MAMDDDMQTFRTKVRTNGDRIRAMTDEELVDVLRCNCCAFHNMPECASIDCKEGHMIWLKQDVSGDGKD